MNNLAILLVRRRQTNEAVKLLERAVQAQPDFDQAYLNLARIHVSESRNTDARRVLETLLSRQPRHSLARTMLNRIP
jgi:Tfp pilus assembly protein PilF